jgi:hypothetical protein
VYCRPTVRNLGFSVSETTADSMFDTDTSERRGVSSKKKKKQRQTEEFGQSDLSGVKFENPTWDSGEVEFENPASDVAFEEEGVQQPSQSAANPRLRTFDVSVDGTAQSSQESTARSDKSAEKFSSLLGKESAYVALHIPCPPPAASEMQRVDLAICAPGSRPQRRLMRKERTCQRRKGKLDCRPKSGQLDSSTKLRTSGR